MGVKFFLTLLFVVCCSVSHGQKLVRIALIADPQYADKDTHGSRYYRNSLAKLDSAVSAINAQEVDFTITLGDLVDMGPKDLPPVLQRLDKLHMPVYNIMGNHDFVDVEDPTELYKYYRMPKPYYTVAKGEWLFILLNTNELASYASREGSSERHAWQSLSEGLQKANRKNNQAWNGGLGLRQLKWLEKQLRRAKSKGKKVIIITHHPLFPENGLEALNNREILSIIDRYPVVKAVFSGHHHPGNFASYKGIPMFTLEGMIETADQNAFGILELNENQLILHGVGRMASRKIDY